MALDISAIKKKMEELNKQLASKQGGDSDDKKIIWKPANGSQTIRILPYFHDMDNPFRELYYHYEFDRPYVSPASYGDNNDPVIDFSKHLQNKGDSDSWKMGKKLEPKRRTHVAIIVRGAEAEGVKFWGFSDTVYHQLTSFICDPEYGDITDLQNGFDVIVEVTPGTKDSYAKTTVRPKRLPSPATTEKAIADLIKAMPKLEETFYFRPATEDELKAALKNFLTPAAEGEDKEEQKASVVVTPAPAAKSEAVNAAVNAFTDIFGA